MPAPALTDNSARIAQIQALLQSGVSQVVVDGQTVTLDRADLARELRQLMATDTTNYGRRPVVAKIYLGGY